MANKLVVMSTIKQLLQMHLSGASNRKIARDLGLNRGTVNDYIRKLKSGDMSIDALLLLDDPVLEGKFSAGTAAYTDRRFEDLKEMLPWLEKELGRKHVTRHLLWQEYLTKHPSGYRYTQFCFHLNQLSTARNPTVILTHVAGEKLFVDFAGDKLEYVNMENGEVIAVQVFVACLPFSDYSFIMCVPSQKTDDFIYALTCCLRALGGSPKILVPDNLKAAVIKADRHEPELNRVMQDFANHYNMVVLPARAGHPKDKASVENQVRIIYSRVYAKLRNHRFFSLEELNRAVFEKTLEHNQTRMQRKNYTRQEKFLADEKHTLRALPATDFQIKYYAELRVSNNNCIYLGRDKHHYSVPYIYIGQKVQVIYTRSTVKIYCKNECIATHLRSQGGASHHTACRQGYTVCYQNMQKLLTNLKMARLEGSILKLFDRWAKTQLLIIDDFGLTHLQGQLQNDFLEIIEDRHGRHATIITSQLPVSNWFDVIGDAVIADAVLDRLVHFAHRFELKGESLRKKMCN